LIRVADLRSGAIEHDVNIALPCVRAAAFSWPAQRTDGRCPASDAPAEGERFRLPASLDLSRLGLSRGDGSPAEWLQGFPWQDLLAVAWNYGEPAPAR
jgi:hypothetical protein